MGEEYDPCAFVAVDEDGRGEDSVELLLVEDMVGGKGVFGGTGCVMLADCFGADAGDSSIEGVSEVQVKVFEVKLEG